MALQINVVIQAQNGDTNIAHVLRGRLTFNPTDEVQNEVDLAKAAARSQVEQALQEFDESLEDWGRAVARIMGANRDDPG